MPNRRILALVTSLFVALATVVLPTAVPAATADDAVVPADGVLHLDGRGFGHGRGMSQWGARGAASSGLTWSQIVAFYYPGTTQFDQGDTPIRVWISADGDQTTEVVPQPGLTVSSGAGSLVLPVGAQYDSWRTRRSGPGFVLERRDGGAWSAVTTAFPLTSDVRFTAPSRLLRLVLPDGTQQSLRGEVRAVPSGTGSRSVAVLPMEDYLRSVVPIEMSAGWPAQALMSQSVAARSYASRARADVAASATYDTCDTTSCQVFAGTARYRPDGSLISVGEHAATDAAIAATAGIVLRYVPAGTSTPRIAFTQFSTSNGGWSVAGGTSHPYLVARSDPYDGLIASTAHAWTATVPAATVESRLPSIGALRRISVDARDGRGELGGRILSATVTGTAGSVSLTGPQLRTTLGTRSDWFGFVGAGFSRDWDGDEVGDVLAVDTGGRLLMYPGNGRGAFSTSRQVGNGWSGLDLVTQVGDWDGDGRNDVIARDRVGGVLRLYPGAEGGRFLAQRQIGSGWQGFDAIVAPGDWDGDGAADLLARRTSDGTLWLYPGTGTGGFGRPSAVGSGWSGMALVTAVGDWDADGNVDLISRRSSDGTLWLYRGNGASSFLRSVQVGTGWSSMTALVGPGDWNGDGRADLIARHVDGTLSVYPGGPAGGFLRPVKVGSGWSGLTLTG